MASDFSKYLIKEYEYWSIYLHENQGYLGRCIIWCKRENAFDLTDTTEVEQIELFTVLRILREALIGIFGCDWLNYSFLGNEIRHLHGHVIPRYAKPKEFMGVVFEDKLYGHRYKADPSFIIPEKVFNEIKTKIQEALKIKS